MFAIGSHHSRWIIQSKDIDAYHVETCRQVIFENGCDEVSQKKLNLFEFWKGSGKWFLMCLKG